MTDSARPARAIVDALINGASRRDLAAVARLYAPDAVAVSPVFGELRGRDAIVTSWSTLLSTFADVEVTVSDVLIDGARVAVLGALSTTDQAGWFGLPPTGARVTYRLVLLLTIEGDWIVRDERIYDSAGVVERLEKARLDKELRTAAEVQQALLPRRTYVTRFCASAAASVPCRAIDGDFFEFLDLPGGAVGIVIGDVAGKGPAAALLASLIQGMLIAAAPGDADPAITVARINAQLVARGLGSRYATMFFAVLAGDGRLTYVNGGHNHPLLIGATGSISRLATGGPIVGAFAGAAFEHATVSLAPGETLVLFTDGVTEARNAAGEEFGEERLVAAVTAARSTPDETVDRVLAAVRTFCHGVEQSDDITVAVTRFERRPPGRRATATR